MSGIVKMVYEDARGGPYLRVFVNDKFVSSRPLNPGDKLEIHDLGAMVVMVAKELGAEILVENTRVLYDSRGNRVE